MRRTGAGMSLATRCPSCGTVFRVVQDQLRVSEGWVRCGRCNGVFNAAEVLFDIDSGATVAVDLDPPSPASFAPPSAPRPAAPPLPRHAPAEAAAPAAAGSAPPASSQHPANNAPWTGGRQEPRFDADAHADVHADAHTDVRADAHTDVHADDPWPRAGHAEQPLLRAPSRHQDDPTDEIIITDHVPRAGAPAQAAAQPSGLADEPAIRTDFSAAATAAARLAATATAHPAAHPAVTTPASATFRPSPVQALPSFMRTAERNALWRRPAMRAAAGIGVALLGIVLVLQAAVLWRDTLAARWPASAPALAELCRLVGCSVQPLRRIESLAVRSSGLNRLDGSTLYRLQVVLQNRADTALMMPALDLSLNDAQGKLVARRVLQAAELGAPQAVLQAGQELPIQALLSTGERRVDGYTLELFYP
jgi:predicted Zn finger-like uncharacterized protein